MSQGYGQPGYGQQPPPPQGQPQQGWGQPQPHPPQGQPQPGWGQENGGYNPRPAPGEKHGSGGANVTVGLIVAAVGAVVLLVAVFGMDFVTVESSRFGQTVNESLSFDDLRDLEDLGVIEFNGRTGLYIQFTMIFSLVAVAASVGGSLFEGVARVGVALPALFLFWHLGAAFMWDTAPGESISPAAGTWVGVAGYAALAAAPLIRVPLGGGQKSVTHI